MTIKEAIATLRRRKAIEQRGLDAILIHVASGGRAANWSKELATSRAEIEALALAIRRLRGKR